MKTTHFELHLAGTRCVGHSSLEPLRSRVETRASRERSESIFPLLARAAQMQTGRGRVSCELVSCGAATTRMRTHFGPRSTPRIRPLGFHRRTTKERNQTQAFNRAARNDQQQNGTSNLQPRSDSVTSDERRVPNRAVRIETRSPSPTPCHRIFSDGQSDTPYSPRSADAIRLADSSAETGASHRSSIVAEGEFQPMFSSARYT